MKTSETVAELGLYESACCGEELIFDDGDIFSRCPQCNGLCQWEFLEPVVPCDAFESSEREAA